MLGQEVPRPRRHRALEARFRGQREIARAGGTGIADGIGEMADRHAKLRLQTFLAPHDLATRDIRVVLRQHRMCQRMGADGHARRA